MALRIGIELEWCGKGWAGDFDVGAGSEAAGRVFDGAGEGGGMQDWGEEKGKQKRANIMHKCRRKGDSFPPIKNSRRDAGTNAVFYRAGGGDASLVCDVVFGFRFDL